MSQQDPRNRDPLAIAAAVVSIVVQVGAWFYWGGKLETRVEAVEKRVEQSERSTSATATANAAQDVTIAVITTQLASIQGTVERIDRTLQEEKKR